MATFRNWYSMQAPFYARAARTYGPASFSHVCHGYVAESYAIAGSAIPLRVGRRYGAVILPLDRGGGGGGGEIG